MEQQLFLQRYLCGIPIKSPPSVDYAVFLQKRLPCTQAALGQYGVSEASAAARDRGGVLVNGRSWVNAQQYYEIVATSSGLPQYYTYSATNLRLQEAHIGYTIPRKWLGNICDINVSVVGRNLWMIYCKAPFDPEAIATTSNFYQGIDYFMMPSTRNFGFNVKINF